MTGDRAVRLEEHPDRAPPRRDTLRGTADHHALIAYGLAQAVLALFAVVLPYPASGIVSFGTGYSSLAYISRLPADIVKLDKSFSQNPAGQPDSGPNWQFTGAILQAISSLGLQTIAEGIETAAQDAAFRRLGCPLAQGYFYSRPDRAATIDDFLAESARRRI